MTVLALATMCSTAYCVDGEKRVLLYMCYYTASEQNAQSKTDTAAAQKKQ